MTLPASGQISLSQVNTELGYSSTASITMNDSAVRTLFGVSSGAISMSNGWGKANAFSGTITSNQQQLNLRTWATGAGWNGTTKATITVNSGVYIWSDNTGIAGLTIDGSWPGGCFLVNNGYIMGKGAAGSNCWPPTQNAGGPAISLGVNCTITNNSYIGGGGGSGTGGYAANSGGGGAGGGQGGQSYWGPGGAGGSIGSTGGNGPAGNYASVGGRGGGAGGGGAHGCGSGGGGGRIFPGVGGAAGGAMRYSNSGGGTGGSAGNPGEPGYNRGAAGGGGWGAPGGGSCAGGGGGPGGKAVALNGYSVTWPATGTRYGSIS